jgi:hypothetical protein
MDLLENLNTVVKDKQENLRSQKIDIEHHKRNISDAIQHFVQTGFLHASPVQ